MPEQKIKAGQIWRRNAGGKHIRITRERLGWNGASFDDWRWEGADYKGSGVLYGHSLRLRYTLVDALPQAGAPEDPNLSLAEKILAGLDAYHVAHVYEEGHISVRMATHEGRLAVITKILDEEKS